MALDDDVALLERIPVLEVLGRDALRILAIGAETRRLARGETLFREGEPGDAAYVVISGSLVLRHVLEEGWPETVVRPGAMLGESALLTEVRRTVTAGALDDVVLLRIPRHTFLRTLEGYPAAAESLRDLLARRIADTVDDLDEVRRRLEALGDPEGG